MSSNPLAFLADVPPEFTFIEGQGQSHVALLADGMDFFAELPRVPIYWKPEPPRGPHHPTPKQRRETMIERLADQLNGCTVLQLPEGFGKSSMVGRLAEAGRKVVFVAKTNEQLIEHEHSIRARWSDLRVHRYISKARHLQEELQDKLGVKFEVTYHSSRSPYGTAGVDEASTRQKLRRALDVHGYEDVNHIQLFDTLFTTWRPPRIIGREVDVILITLAAYQGMCRSIYKPWWQRLGLLSGKQRVFREDFEQVDNPSGNRTLRPEMESGVKVPRIDEGVRQRTGEIGLPEVVVIVDDPHRNDFDFRRLVEDEDAVALHQATKKATEHMRRCCEVEYWIGQGVPPRVAAAQAKFHSEKLKAHEIVQTMDHYWEERPKDLYIGYGLRRGYGANDGPPSLVVLTTEHITAQLAYRTLKETKRGGHVRLFQHHKLAVENASRRWDVIEPNDARPSQNCHVTLLATKLVRRSHKALLLLIYMALREEFPRDDLTFIGDALGLDLNLTNNRGRNDLDEKSTLIKLSVPNREVASHLWAQFPGSERPRVLNTILLADLANQAIGRNQGHRWRGRTCTVLIDPMYAGLLVSSQLLRYSCTPWSFHKPKGNFMHGPQTPLEKRLAYFLEPGRARNELGMSGRGFAFGAHMTDPQWAIYEAWLERECMVIPAWLRRHTPEEAQPGL